MVCCNKKDKMDNDKPISEKEILNQLDHIFINMGEILDNGDYYDNFFLDLEDTRLTIASSKIHLLADSSNWAVVFETAGYSADGGFPEINLIYIGNSINYELRKQFNRYEYSNLFVIYLVSPEEMEATRNNNASEIEDNELLGKHVTSVKIRDSVIDIKNDYQEFEKYGIKVSDIYNPNKLIGYDNLMRYLSETQPNVISASESDIKEHLMFDIPQLMSIDKFHYISYYEKDCLPSKQELYQMIAKVLATRDTSCWKPTLPSNNHWSNWESGIK